MRSPGIYNDGKQPVISVITAVFNGGRFLEQAITSVLGQTYAAIEYIIIDGGSTDNTIDIIKKYEDKLHYWISEKDSGVYDAWNKALIQANGEWIVFLGSDDFYIDERVIEESIPHLDMAIRTDIRFVYGKVNLLSLSAKRLIRVMGQPWAAAKKDIFNHMSVTHCGAFHHRTLFTHYGHFNHREFKITGDYEFLLREFARGHDALFIDRTIAGMRAGGLSADLKLKLTLARENIKALHKNNIPVGFNHKLQIYKAYMASVLAKIIGINNLYRISDLYRKMKGEEAIWSKIH